MKTVLTLSLLLVATTLHAAPCKTNMSSNTVVDDFTTGLGNVYSKVSSPNTWLPNATQVGNPSNVMGGMRGFQAQVTQNYLLQPIKADVITNTGPKGGSALALTTGVREGFGLYDFYGYDAYRNVAIPLGLQFDQMAASDCNRIRISFDSNLADLLVVLELRTPGDSTWYMSEKKIGPGPANAAPFCLDIPFDTYFPAGVTQPFTSKGIDHMLLGLSNGNASLGASFAITRIEFKDRNDTSKCLYSAP